MAKWKQILISMEVSKKKDSRSLVIPKKNPTVLWEKIENRKEYIFHFKCQFSNIIILTRNTIVALKIITSIYKYEKETLLEK